MIIPSGEKKTQNYNKAYERAQFWYNKYPKLEKLDTQIADTLLSFSNNNSNEVVTKLKTIQAEHQEFLAKYKIPKDYKSPKFECEKCQDSGWVEEVDYRASKLYGYEIKRVVKCNCLVKAQKQMLINNYFKASCLTPIMKKQTFNRFRLDVYSDIEFEHEHSHRQLMHSNLLVAQDFVKKMYKVSNGVLGFDVKGLYLEGNPGVGKTFLCSAIANSLLKRNVPVLYLPFVDFMQQLRGTISDNRKKVDEYIEAAREVDVLILDDLGAESITDFSQEVLFSIINYRTSCLNKPIIISSNYTIKELRNSIYHARIASRIQKHSDILHCVGDDLREIIK